MAFDGIITKQIVAELQTCLLEGKVNKIYQPNKNEILLGFYTNGKNYVLDIDIASNYYRVHLSTNEKQNPICAPNFCMVLRKHLLGYHLDSISMNGLERIITFSFEGFNELNDRTQKKLIVELMGKHSNIILVNQNNKIIDSIRHLDQSSGSYRDILPAHEYTFPISDKKDFLETSYSDFLSFIKKDLSLSEQISNLFTGISRSFILHTLSHLHIEDTSYQSIEIEKLYQYMQGLLSKIGTSQVSCISILDNRDYTLQLSSHTEILQTNFFLDDFYHQKQQIDLLQQYRNDLLKLVLSALKKVSKKISNINIKLKECEHMDTYRIYGELLTANLYKFDNSTRLDSITLENYYQNNDPITIPLDKSISPSYNAKKYFKKYNKLKNTMIIVSSQKEEAEKELDYLESIVYELENVTQISDIDDIYHEIHDNILPKSNKKEISVKKNKINKRKIHDTYEPLVYQINIGKNNKQNDYISTKLGKNEDLWFHTKDIRGSHAVLKCNGSTVDLDTIHTCAQITAFHSKAKLSSNVPVDYCFVKHVKKPSGSKPGMVIYTNYKTLYVEPKEPI